jgi:glycosyltransferase involved in cell wall biosynthesis
MAEDPPTDFDFSLRYIFPGVRSHAQRGSTFNPVAFIRAAASIVRQPPDILILSLWRACVVGLLVKLVRPRTRLVIVIHNSVDAHPADWLFTRLAMRFSTAIWSDSAASMRLRFHTPPRTQVTILPFLTKHLSVARQTPAAAQAPGFMFWGRLAAQKNLPRALELFRIVHRARPDALYTIIGPDSGELERLREWCAHSGLGDAVSFAGPMDLDAICRLASRHVFYLQTSDYEGMAMAVVEAMQLGLVPVVTPVGEIAQYCRDGANSVVVGDLGDAAARVLALLDDPGTLDRIRESALATWRGHPLYRDAVGAECRRLISTADR